MMNCEKEREKEEISLIELFFLNGYQKLTFFEGEAN